MKRRGTRLRSLWSRLITVSVRLGDISPSRGDLKRSVARDWRSDTGRSGFGLSERIRDIWRRRWLRFHR